MTAFKETLRTINNRSGRTLAVDDDDFIDTSDLDVSLGDPIGFSNQTSVTVRVAAHVWYQKDIDIIDFLDRVRKALLDKKCEAYWSCAQRNDKRTTVIFSFRISPDAVDDITPTDARKAVTTLCKTAGHPITSAYAIDFQRARDNDKPLQVTVKFVHVASVFLFPSTVKPADLQLGNYTITYGPCLSVIPPTYPTTMASPHKAEVPEHALRSELKRWIKRYNKKNDTTDGLRDQGYMAHGRYFVVTPTSMALAEYIASQECEFGFPYELVYDLNDRSLVPAAAVAERDRNNQQRLTNEATSALNALTTRIVAAEKAQADNAQTMVVVQHTLKTMAQDNRKNHRALFDYQQHRDSLRDEQNSIRFQLADVKGDIRSCDSQIHPLRVQLIEYSVNDDPQAQAKATQYQSLLKTLKDKRASLEKECHRLERQLVNLDEQAKRIVYVDYVDNTTLLADNNEGSLANADNQPDTAIADKRRFEALADSTPSPDKDARTPRVTKRSIQSRASTSQLPQDDIDMETVGLTNERDTKLTPPG